MRTRLADRLACIAFVAVAAAGCAAQKSAPGDGDIGITRIERIGWNEPPEPNLFRVEFGAARSLEIRRRAEQVSGNDLMSYLEAQAQEMERASHGEFVARGLCSEGGKVISVAEGGANSAALAGYFRCRPKGIF